ncbi:hypothetical protein AX14_010002 [Amanita brunnescens Koide BX004]|nr:hypothetical protein AX14_010002 [Amanita brunnescens Koide BX004]
MAQCMSLTWVDNREWHSCIKAAREIIYVKGYKMDSKVVEDLLQCDSLVLTVNAFSDKLTPLSFNMFNIFVVDLMHEVELGVWCLSTCCAS